MGIYINSKGVQIDTATMDETYINRALQKAIREGNADNEVVLEEELALRGE